jgi:hypothetical protein
MNPKNRSHDHEDLSLFFNNRQGSGPYGRVFWVLLPRALDCLAFRPSTPRAQVRSSVDLLSSSAHDGRSAMRCAHEGQRPRERERVA